MSDIGDSPENDTYKNILPGISIDTNSIKKCMQKEWHTLEVLKELLYKDRR